MQKKVCAVYGEGAVTDGMCQKWFAKFCGGAFSLADAPQSGRPVEVSNNRDINWEQSTLYHAGDNWHTQNIQISKVIGKNEKCVFYLMEKTRIFSPTQLFKKSR